MTTETSNARGLVAKWRTEAAALDEKAAEREPDGRLVWAEWMRDRMSVEASTKRGDANELEAALNATPPPPADAEVRDDDIDDEHSCVAGGPAWQEGFNAGRATGRNEALDELRKAAPEARGVVDGEAVEKVIGEMSDYLDQEVDPELDTIEKWRTALTEARNVR